MRSAPWLFILVLLAGLGIGRDAHAGAKMDWSDYLEPPGSRAPARTAPAERPAKATASKSKASRTTKKKLTKSQSKKAKRAVRSKRRR